MKFKDYFIKAKNYFIALIVLTIIQALITLFNTLTFLLTPLSIIKLGVVVIASYKLRLKIKESLILGALMFLSVIWYVFFALPVSIFMLDLLNMTLVIITNSLINTGIYAGVSLITRLISNKAHKKK